MSDYKIEKKVPIPNTTKRNNYPLGEMGIGDSFQLGGNELNQVRTAASWYGKRNGRKFAVRRYKDGYRCWRVE